MADFPAALLDTSEQEGIRTVALALLADAVDERDRMATAPDDEALHDFRVAVRRLRSWLRAHREALGDGVPKVARRGLRRVAQATNAARDVEVFTAWLAEAQAGLDASHQLGATWLRDAVRDRVPSHAAATGDDVAAAFARARDALEERLPIYQVTHHLTEGARHLSFASAMAAALRIHAVGLRRRLQRVEGPADDAAAHRARIAGKRLRYLLEPVAPHLEGGLELIGRLKALQDTLGDLHDSHVWLSDLRRRFERLGADEARHLADATVIDATGADPRPDLRPGLMAVTTALRERARQRHADFAAAWDAPGTDAFLAGIEHVATTLDHHGMGGVEIERKYLLRAMPEYWPEGDVLHIEQGYLPGERLVERLRRVRSRDGEHWYRTVKSGTGMARLEVEEEASREVFDALWPLTAGRRVTKRRHRIPDGEVTWELDEFTDRELVLAEVELRHVDEVVQLPAWLEPVVVREVTGEPEYVNASLAR